MRIALLVTALLSSGCITTNRCAEYYTEGVELGRAHGKLEADLENLNLILRLSQ